MYSIVVKGNQQSGKSTTIREVCRLLTPSKIRELKIKERQIGVDEIPNDRIFNGTYLLEVNGKSILVIAGAPTEQDKTVTQIVDICIELKIPIDFIISAMRSKEMKSSFDTIHELKKMSSLLQIFKIVKIDGEDFQASDEWNKRISDILKVVNENLK